MAPVVALFGGFLINGAIERLGVSLSRWHPLIPATAAAVIAWIAASQRAELAVLWICAVCATAGLLLRNDSIKNVGTLPRGHAFILLIALSVLLNCILFLHTGWYYRGKSAAGWRAAVERATADVNSGLALTSAEHIRKTVGRHIVSNKRGEGQRISH